MTEDQIEDIFLIIVKAGAVVALIFNAGIGLILLRQLSTMNSVLKVKSTGATWFLILGFLLVVALSLIYAIVAV